MVKDRTADILAAVAYRADGRIPEPAPAHSSGCPPSSSRLVGFPGNFMHCDLDAWKPLRENPVRELLSPRMADPSHG